MWTVLSSIRIVAVCGIWYWLYSTFRFYWKRISSTYIFNNMRAVQFTNVSMSWTSMEKAHISFIQHSHLTNIIHQLHSNSKDLIVSQQNQTNGNYTFQFITEEPLFLYTSLQKSEEQMSIQDNLQKSGWVIELSVTYGQTYHGGGLFLLHSSMWLFDSILRMLEVQQQI